MIPNTIPFTSIDLGERGRTTYKGIDELAQSIHDNGLIQPLVLCPIIGYTNEENQTGPIGCEALAGSDRYLLVAGGRRFHALQSLGFTKIYHAVTCDPKRPGFILKGETSPFSNLLAEIAENLDRHNLDWRDEVRLMVKAWKLAKIDNNSRGEQILMRDFGASIGVGYAYMQAANFIVNDLNANPKAYENVGTIRAAQAYLLKKQADEVAKLITAKTFAKSAPLVQAAMQPRLEGVPARESNPEIDCEPEAQVIELSKAFLNTNGIDFMSQCPDACFDHIVTDPDYAIDIEVLNSKNGSGYDIGIAQATIEDSLSDMRTLITQAFRTIKPQGFLVFFYDLDHHEKLKDFTTSVGFAVQRWPLLWHKTDYRSNASPSTNFCKNMEYAMVCRKPGSVLAKVQMSSVVSLPTGDITKRLGHPFAKPFDLWKFIYSAITIRGQNVFDPCVGRGSSALAALQFGLQPLGCEINPEHFAGLQYNLQEQYKVILGANTHFV